MAWIWSTRGGSKRRASALSSPVGLVYRAPEETSNGMTWLIAPDPAAPRLTRAVKGVDQEGRPVETRVVEERPLTIFLNAQEIVTVMTIGDYPEYLAAGYLLNQGMLRRDDK